VVSRGAVGLQVSGAAQLLQDFISSFLFLETHPVYYKIPRPLVELMQIWKLRSSCPIPSAKQTFGGCSENLQRGAG
jgi:hypothetical protein